MVDYPKIECAHKKKDVPKVLAQEWRLQTDDGRKMKDLEQLLGTRVPGTW